MTRSQTIMCQHNKTVDDWRTGDEVCLSCGVVVGNIMLDSNMHTERAVIYLNHDEDIVHLKKLCDKIPCTDICTEHIIATYKKFKRKSQLQKDYLYAASIYSTLNKENCSKSIEYVCNLCSVKTKKFWKLIKNLDIEYTVKTTNMTEYYLQNFKFSYNDIKAINNIIDKLCLLYNLNF